MAVQSNDRTIRLTAGVLLNERNCRLVMTLSSILLVLICATSFLFAEVRSFLSFSVWAVPSDVWTAIFWTFGGLLFVFFFLPILLSFQTMGAKIVRREETSVSDLFTPFFGAKTYRLYLTIAVCLFSRLVPLIAAAVVAVCFIVLFVPNLWIAVILTSVAVLTAVVIGIFLWASRFSLLYWVFFRGWSLKDARKKIYQNYGKNLSAGLHFFFCNALPQIVLGCLTVGLWWVGDAMERMPVMYYLFCRELFSESINSDHSTSEDIL